MKKGFTLVELLATIIVLAIIALIAVGLVSNNISNSKEKVFVINVNNLLEATKEYVTKNMDNYDFPKDGIDVTNSQIEIKNNPFTSGIIKKNDEGQIIVENVTDGKYCANGTKNDLKISSDNCKSLDETPPTLSLKELKTTNVETTIMIKTQDSGSGIKEYEYCLNENCKKIEKNLEKTIIKEIITIEKLSPNEEYTIKVKSTNGNGKITQEEIKIKTREMEEPKFKISSSTYATNKELIIIYPDIENEFKKYYKIGEEKIEVTEKEIKVEIKSSQTVRASIEKNGEEIIYNEIIINGIDTEGPMVNLIIPDIDRWTKTKKIKVEATDEGTGIALRPYSYDGGKVWQKGNEITIDQSQKLNIKVRDRLGNINKTFKINGTTICNVDSDNLCAINNVDSVEPKITIEVTKGTKITTSGYTDWYNSNQVEVTIKIEDYYKKEEKVISGGSGINEGSLKITYNSKKLNYEKVSDGVYKVILTESANAKLNVDVSDNVGNKATSSKTIKIDNITPVINLKNNPLTLGNVNYDFKNNLNMSYGPIGGNVNCNPGSSTNIGTYNASYSVTCTATSINGRTSKKTFTVNHKYKDLAAPKITIEVTKGTKITTPGYTDWYNSDQVEATIKIEDYYKFFESTIIGGSGINESSLKVFVNSKLINPTKISSGTYKITLSESKSNLLNVEINDNEGNLGKNSKTIKIDNILPIIKPKSNPLSLGNVEYAFTSNLNITYGPTNGNTVCNPAKSLKTGTYNVTCTITGNNGKKSSTTFSVRHSYAATYVPRTCTGQRNCRQERYCTSSYSCDPWYCPDWGSSCVRQYGGSPQCGCHQTFGSTCCRSYADHRVCDSYTYNCSYYTCPNGGSLSGSTCNY